MKMKLIRDFTAQRCPSDLKTAVVVVVSGIGPDKASAVRLSAGLVADHYHAEIDWLLSGVLSFCV